MEVRGRFRAEAGTGTETGTGTGTEKIGGSGTTSLQFLFDTNPKFRQQRTDGRSTRVSEVTISVHLFCPSGVTQTTQHRWTTRVLCVAQRVCHVAGG